MERRTLPHLEALLMSQPQNPVSTDPSHGFFERVFGVAITALLLWGSFQITLPFAAAIVWGVMISVSIWPLHQRLSHLLHGRVKLSAILLSATLAAVLVVPVAGLLGSLTDGVQMLLAKTESADKVQVPPPPAFLAKLPLVGEKLQQTWTEAAGNVEGTLTKL